MKTEDLLREELNSEIDQLKTLELGTEKYDKTVTGVCKMLDKLNDLERIRIEYEKVDNEAVSLEIEQQKSKSESKDRKTKNVLTAAGLGLTATGLVLTWLFEEKGTIVLSQGGRKIYDRVFNPK